MFLGIMKERNRRNCFFHPRFHIVYAKKGNFINHTYVNLKISIIFDILQRDQYASPPDA